MNAARPPFAYHLLPVGRRVKAHDDELGLVHGKITEVVPGEAEPYRVTLDSPEQSFWYREDQVKRRVAAYVNEAMVNAKGDNVVVLCTEGETGYCETTYTGSLDYCQEVAASINAANHVTEREALEITASTFNADAADAGDWDLLPTLASRTPEAVLTALEEVLVDKLGRSMTDEILGAVDQALTEQEEAENST